MILEDVRAAARSVLRARGLTFVLLLSLGLGTGANAAVYSVVNALLFRPPQGVTDAVRLISIHTTQFDGSPYGASSWNDFLSIRTEVPTLQAVAAYDDRTTGNVRLGECVRLVRSAAVTVDFFSTLGMGAAAGRLLDPSDWRPQSPAAVISASLWDECGRPSLNEATVGIGAEAYRVVGVTPERFRGLQGDRLTDVWILLKDEEAGGRGDRRLSLIARVRNGHTPDEVNQQLDRLSTTLAERFPVTNKGLQGDPERPRRMQAVAYSPLQPEARRRGEALAAIIGGAVVLLLVSACCNAGTLLLSRGFARRRELAVKMALGASRARLFRQVLYESLFIALAAAAAGLLLAWWTLQAIPSLFSPEHAALLDTRLPPVLILVALVIATVAGFAFGIPPAVHATSSGAATVLRGDAGAVAGDRGGRWLRASIVGAQLTVSTVLLLAAGLLVLGVRAALDAEPGFPAREVVVVTLENPGRFIDPLRGIAFQRALVGSLKARDDVAAVGWAGVAPLIAPPEDTFRIAAGAADVSDAVSLDVNVVSASYFAALGMQVIEGRGFSEHDRALTEPVVIVGELLARRFFGSSATQQHLIDASGERLRIVGVVREPRYRALQSAARPTVYYPVTQRYQAQGNLLIVSRGEVATVLEALPRIIRSIDREANVQRLTTMDRHLSEALAIDRLTTVLVAVCGALALFMAVVGVYGVMSDAVGRRTREIGLRVALGAARLQIARMVFAEAMLVSLIGIAAGFVVAIAGRQAVAAFAAAGPAWDAASVALPLGLLAIVVAVAAIGPLRRALSVSAAVALRE